MFTYTKLPLGLEQCGHVGYIGLVFGGGGGQDGLGQKRQELETGKSLWETRLTIASMYNAQ